MKVEIYKTQADGSQKLVLTCIEDSSGVRFEGDEVISANLLEDGVSSHTNKDLQLFPSNGRAFLEELQFVFNSPYLRASAPISQ